ncbi:MAG: hypothetical protein JW943_07855 [Deltaproteobacteria bacterium]|nr:hypothetical protein [Deltaproteobacteria bacterium]
MQTSYFSKSATLPNAVAISQGVPKWFKGKTYKALAPSWALISIKDEVIYTREYHLQVLSKLDPKKVFSDLGEDAVLLCWEAPDKFCHRRLVAKWLEENLNITVPEL